LFGIFIFLFTGSAQATPIIYTDHADYLAAITGLNQQTLDFEDMDYGDAIASGSTVGGITFTYDFGGVEMMVTDTDSEAYPTTSGTNYLGTDDLDILQDGDDFGLSFAASVNAIGMFFLSDDELWDDDIKLSAGGVDALLDVDTVSQSWVGGRNAFFLGIVDVEDSFANANITTIGGGFFTYNVDDIMTASATPIPEPATIMLFGIGLLGLSRINRKMEK
jgi:hypothetical protein